MKIVRFRGRFVAVVAVSLICTLAVLRSLLLPATNGGGQSAVGDFQMDQSGSVLADSKNNPMKGRFLDSSSQKLKKAKKGKVKGQSGVDAEQQKEQENYGQEGAVLSRDSEKQPSDRNPFYLKKSNNEKNDENLNDVERRNPNENLANPSNNNNNNLNENDKFQKTNEINKPVDAVDVEKEVKDQPKSGDSAINTDLNRLTDMVNNKFSNINNMNNNNNNLNQVTSSNAVSRPDDEALPAHLQAGSKYPLLYNNKFIPIRRIIHLDLKGAHPKLHYFEKFFEMISKLGATGILIEYEDVFPFTGPLAFARSGRAYSEKSVRTILSWAQKYKLDVIPLVQTFGHLEWILKHDRFKQYREVDRYAQVICLSNFDAVKLVKMAIDQVMALHKDYGEFFHMGADEAFQIGMCDRCQKTIRNELNNNRDRLMLRHIANISSYVREKYGKRVLMWHDMLNNVDSQTIKEYKVDKLVEPVVWAYAENLNDYLMPDMWMRFSSAFPYIWGSSAYKGADGPSRYYSNVPHYLQNHVSWTGQMTREYKNFKEFRGLIMTGWQRFDHFAVLCEILPVGVPSLAVNLLTIQYGNYDRSILKRVSKLLECSGTLEVESPGVAAYCQFPGAKVYQFIQQFHSAQLNMRSQLLEDYQLKGWLSQYNMRHNYSSAWYLDQIVDKVNMYRNELLSITRQLRTEMSRIFFSDAVDEFFFEYIQPDVQLLDDLLKNAQHLAKIRTFPGRPFVISGAETAAPGEATESP